MHPLYSRTSSFNTPQINATMSTNTLANFFEVSSPEHFQSLLSTDLTRISLINFWAPWAEPCKQMNEVVFELAKKYPQLLVLQVREKSVTCLIRANRQGC